MSRDAILITGAAGFIGRHLMHFLARSRADATGGADATRGAELILVEHPDQAKMAAWQAEHAGLSEWSFRVVALDLEDRPAVLRAPWGESPRAVYHLAGGRRAEHGAALEGNRANLDSTLHLLEAMAKSPPEAFVLASTGEVYGRQPAPFREDQPMRPETPYAVSKALAEVAGLAAFNRSGFPFVVARLAVVYGPGQATTMFVPQLVEAIVRGEPFEMTRGEQLRDLVYVQDVARALVALAGCEKAAGQVVNVGSGQGIRLSEVAETALRVAGKSVPLRIGALPYRTGEVMDYRFAVDILTRLTGWTAEVSLEEGLRRTIEGARSTAGAPCLP